MRIFNPGTPVALTAVVAAVLLSSCAVTTRSMEGTTETLANTSEASTETTSSTSPRDDVARADARTLAFTRANLARLRTDMAAGGGEHLATLGSLLRVSPVREGEFFALTRERFDALFDSERTTADQLLARLDRELASRPQLRD